MAESPNSADGETLCGQFSAHSRVGLCLSFEREPETFLPIAEQNGIDGLISTFAGVAQQKGSNWAILGDLSLLYDFEWTVGASPKTT